MKKYDIFISHDSQDKDVAGEIKTFLEGIFLQSEVYVSGQNISGGDAWYNSIVAALKGSKVIISLISKNSINNNWLYFETGAGAMESKSIPLLAHDLDFEDLKNYPVSNIQARKMNSDGIFKLVNDVARLLDVRNPVKKNIGDVKELIEKCRTLFLETDAEKVLVHQQTRKEKEDEDKFSSSLENNKLQVKLESEVQKAEDYLKSYWIELAHKKAKGKPIIHGIHKYKIPELYNYLLSIGITSQVKNYTKFIEIQKRSLSPSNIQDKESWINWLQGTQRTIELLRR